MKLSIWQFLALLGALLGGYLIYTTWFTKQDQSGWINNFNNSISGEESRESTTKSGGAAAEQPTDGSSSGTETRVW